MYTNGVHIEHYDQPEKSWNSEGPYWLWFRFVSNDKLYKMNVITCELIAIEPELKI